jgi:hypothetical protein
MIEFTRRAEATPIVVTVSVLLRDAVLLMVKVPELPFAIVRRLVDTAAVPLTVSVIPPPIAIPRRPFPVALPAPLKVRLPPEMIPSAVIKVSRTFVNVLVPPAISRTPVPDEFVPKVFPLLEPATFPVRVLFPVRVSLPAPSLRRLTEVPVMSEEMVAAMAAAVALMVLVAEVKFSVPPFKL